jgi:hypothetical protein
LSSSSSFAARPLITDDARLTTSGSCQLEAYTRIYKDSTEKWATPACNLTGNFEVTAGVGDIKSTGDPVVKDYVLQAKTVFVNSLQTTSGWAWAWVKLTIQALRLGPMG